MGASGADFDVTGALWLLQNIPRLTAIVLTVLAISTSVHFWKRFLRGY